VEQGLQFGAEVHLGEEVASLTRVQDNGEEILVVTTESGKSFPTRTVIVTAGHGAFETRKLGIEGIDEWEGSGLHYFVKQKDAFRGKSCVIVGGGDSALDWTLGLQDTAKLPITLLHRRERFRALESSVSHARQLEEEGKVRIIVPSEVREIRGNGAVERLIVENTSTGELEEVDCEALITLLGFHSHLGHIADWGLALHGKRQILVNPANMETTIEGVYAAGDVAGYDGKITLISVGFGEAAIAANQAVAKLRGEKVQPKYSTD
jgi:thioredoxin reductase (NADPH)